MSLFKLIGDNGLWTTLKMLGSQVLQDGLYEAAREHYIVSGTTACPGSAQADYIAKCLYHPS
jgi:hypothetical protein